MKVKGVGVGHIETIAMELGMKLRNPDWRGDWYKFALRPNTAVPVETRPFVVYSQRRVDTIKDRRVFAVCWHGHYAFMRRLFGVNRNAVIKTFSATYNGLDDFETKAVQSNQTPWSYDAYCVCDGTDIELAKEGKLWHTFEDAITTTNRTELDRLMYEGKAASSLYITG